MKTKKPSRFLCLLVCAAMVFTLLPAMSTTAEAAAFTATADLPKNAGATLTNGNIYRVSSNTTISAGSGGNALNVADNATVVIYIPTGYTLTLNGGGGYSTTPGGAGLYLPSTSTLILTGGGRLVANGGGSGYSGYGGGGTSGYVSGIGWNGYAYTGYGGSGGYGAGGAGAGIGGSGGSGGYGGGFGWGSNWSNGYSVTYNSDGSGNPGSNGGSGNPGTTMGNLYVLGTVSVNATGGGAAGGRGGGSYGSYDSSRFFSTNGEFVYTHTASGGGGGGGGGSTRSAPAIGGGSGGAGGGGGGGGGARYSTTGGTYYYSGYGGGGGTGGASGSTGPQYGGSSGGYGGGGGGRGSFGNNGTLYKAAGASVSGRGADIVANTHDSVKCTITFDYQGGTSLGATTLDVSYGEFYPNVKIPTRDQYKFMGYYTAANGGGTRYFDHRGAGLCPFETTGTLTLYAYWVQEQFNVTLDKQTGTGGISSFITTGNDGTLPTSITVPTKDYAIFKGYHAAAAGGGEKYFDSVGTPVAGKKLTTNSVLYAFWEQTRFRLTFGRQGGTGGTDFIYTNETPNATAQNITPPTKSGAAFLGYYTQSTGGKQIYKPDGMAADGTTFAADTMLYAQWQEATYTITYVLGGGETVGAPTSREYSKPTTIPAATRAGYTFLGWQVDQIDTVRYRDLKIPAFAKDYAKDITLTAIWAKGADTDVVLKGNVQLATGNDVSLKSDLANSFDTVVTEGNKGVTSSDLANDKTIKLVLSVNKLEMPKPETPPVLPTDPVTPPDKDKPTTPVAAPAVGTPPDTGTPPEHIPPTTDDKDLIGSIAQGEVLSYYDISAVKEVTAGNTTTTTSLLEIPESIAVKIPLTGELANMASYRVYRVHDGKSELLPTGPTGREYYSVEDGNIVIRTRKFSTYGVVGAKSQIATQPGESFERGGENVDVQGRVIEGDKTLVYKVDIAWGSMAFEYSLDKEWDPVTHMYTEGALNAWRPTGFDGVNNRIRSINHSNGAVKLNLAVTKNELKGVTMTLHTFNEETAVLAQNFILPPAPVGSKDADLQPAVAYLRLSGPPERAWIDSNKTNFAKVGVITVTVEPHIN